ncbi:MAG: hypothetical protein AAGF19_00730 [Pseudomonadota bacterium]
MMSGIFDDQAKTETGWRTAFNIIVVTLILSVGVLYYYFGPTISEIRGNKPQASASSAPVDLSIGEERFVIPENYTQFPRARRGGVRENVALYALMPKLEPFSAAFREIFESHEPNSPVLHFQLESFRGPFSESEHFERVLMREVEDVKGEPGPHGLTRYAFQTESGYRNEELFTFREPDGELVVIRCFKPLEQVQSPSCRRDLKLLPTVILSYRYKRTYLKTWREIDTNIRTLALSFHRPGPVGITQVDGN